MASTDRKIMYYPIGWVIPIENLIIILPVLHYDIAIIFPCQFCTDKGIEFEVVLV
jgi:hypothetical protein